jgi:tetratricopeptide (TPR) repeat protein
LTFLLVVVLDYLWEPFVKSRVPEAQAFRLKITISVVLLLFGFLQIWSQYHKDAQSELQMRSMQSQLAGATMALSNSTALTRSMEGELLKLRNQSDVDITALVDQLVSKSFNTPDQRFYAMGVFALMTGRGKQAQMNFKRCLQVNPLHSQALNNLALITESGAGTNALRDFQLAYQADTNNTPARWNYAIRLQKSGRTDDALRILTNVRDFSEMTEECVLSMAASLALLPGKTDFFRPLDYYVRTAITPQVTKVIPILALHIGELAPDQQSSLSNWPSYFSEPDKSALELLTCSVHDWKHVSPP